MSYEPLHEILAKLEAQQRCELTSLSSSVDHAQMDHKRSAKKQLSTAAVFFIEQSWEALAPTIETFSLEGEAKKSPEELQAYLNSLRSQQPSYAWAWVRARMNARLMQCLKVCVPDLLRQHPEMAALYHKSLRQVDTYWFRETPLHHLKAGYHTALGVACKWYGSAFELRNESPGACPHESLRFSAELRQFASFSMSMLTRTEGYLWDSAGAAPMNMVLEEGVLKLRGQLIEEIALESAPDYGVPPGLPCVTGTPTGGNSGFPRPPRLGGTGLLTLSPGSRRVVPRTSRDDRVNRRVNTSYGRWYRLVNGNAQG